jgi:hypothetical protein
MKFWIFSLCLFSLTAFAQPKDQSFDLYAQGKVRESLISLRQELREQSFNPFTLNSQLKRSLSAYRGHREVEDELFYQVLDLIARQPEAKKMESSFPSLHRELKSLRAEKASAKQTENVLDSSLRRGKDSALTPNDPERMGKIQAVRTYAGRQALRAKGDAFLQWTFIAGKAGFYYFNTGNEDLNKFIQMCELKKAASGCQRLKDAKSMLDLGRATENPQ